jgi:hypothetical protein
MALGDIISLTSNLILAMMIMMHSKQLTQSLVWTGNLAKRHVIKPCPGALYDGEPTC